MELSIEQLADLKIAIEKSAIKEKELIQKVNELNSMFNHLQSENKRLESEIKQQADIKENLILENNEIRKQKDVINGEYEIKNQENYKKISEAQNKLDETKGLVDMRLLEVEKREKDLVKKLEENQTLIKENKKIKEEIGEERLSIERLLKETQEQRQKSVLETEIKMEAYIKLEEKEKEIENQRNILNEKIEENAKQLNEINGKYIEIKAQEKYFETILPNIDNFKEFLKEVKQYVIENGNITQEQINTLAGIEKTIKNKDVSNDLIKDDTNKGNEEITTENEEKAVNYENMSIAELKTLLTNAGIEFNTNNNNKASLIKLLNS